MLESCAFHVGKSTQTLALARQPRKAAAAICCTVPTPTPRYGPTRVGSLGLQCPPCAYDLSRLAQTMRPACRALARNGPDRWGKTGGPLRTTTLACASLAFISLWATTAVARPPQAPQVKIVTPSTDRALPDPIVIQALVRSMPGSEITRVVAYLDDVELGVRTRAPFRWVVPRPEEAVNRR